MEYFQQDRGPEVQEAHEIQEMGEHIETLTAHALVVNENYAEYAYTNQEEIDGKQMRERTRAELESLGFAPELIEKLVHSLVGIATNEGYGSGVFIRPNVIMTAAHVLRDTDSGEITKMRLIANANQEFFKAKSIYYTKIKSEDIAFIVTDGEAQDYLDIYNRDLKEGENVYTFGLSRFKPRFTQGTERSTFFQDSMWLRPGGMDLDHDGKDDGEEYLLTDNSTLPGDSGGVGISSTGEVLGIVSQGPQIRGVNVGGSYLEPQSKIVYQYGDFIQAMTQLGIEIK